MVRKNIFKLLENKFDIKKEFNKINTLFESNLVQYSTINFQMYQGTIENFINEKFLLFWKQRGCYFSCQELRNDIGFTTDNYKKANILTALEYYVNLINILNINLKRNYANLQFYREYYLLVQNIDLLIEHLNYEKHIFEKEEKVILIPKNPAATSVAEISTEDTAMSILMYHHASLKGDLQQKREILRQIAQEYEPLLKSPNENYKDFYKKANALLNNLHIRHNNKRKEHNKNPIIDIDNKELEKWYDELYQLLLFCVLIPDNINRKNNIGEFLKKI